MLTKSFTRNACNDSVVATLALGILLSVVFLIPIVFACMHIAAVLPIIHKLLQLFGHNNMPLLLGCAGVCVLVCGIFYAVIYKLTSNAYYRIVS